MNLTVSRIVLIGSIIAINAVPALALAHHSFASEFDRNQPFNIEGSVKSVEWTNPHGWLHVEVEEDGKVVTYDLELPSPNTLMRDGWRRDDLQPGDRIVVSGFRARDRREVGRASDIRRENGEVVFGDGAQNTEALER